MDWNLKTTGIVIAIFFIGYIIGLVEAAIKQKAKDKKKARVEEKEVMEIPATQPSRNNLLSINRTPSNSLVLELNGKTISNKDELSPENKRLLINLLMEVRPWLETTSPAPIPPKTTTQPEVVDNVMKASAEKNPLNAALSPQSAPAEPTGSIVSQINKILQSRLAASSFATQGIRLQESLSGGVMVYVGLTKYESIDAVPDPEIQAFIRNAVKEWEG